MKTTIKVFTSLLLIGVTTVLFAQQNGTNTQPKPSQKNKKHVQKKPANGIDNKIAVSDQVQPDEKGKKKQAVKKGSGISNK